MNISIRERLLRAEDELLASVADDTANVETFETSWVALQRDIDIAIHAGQLSKDTMALIHTVASRVAILTERLLDMHVKSQTLSCTLQLNLDDILARACINDNHKASMSGGLSQANSHTHNAIDTALHPCPPYIESAYKWLLKNLHDPYPSKATKELISKNSCTSVDNVSAWFTNARRRMGWTAVSRQYFHNCRADTLDAAYRALVQEDSKRQLDPNIVHAFMVVKVTAEGLYSAKFKRSALAGQLDVVVKDMTDEDRWRMEKMKIQEAEEGRKRRDAEKEQRRQERAKQREILKAARSLSKSYPSPVCSPCESPVPVLEDSFTGESEDEEDYVFPQTLAGNKRRVPTTSTISTPLCRDERPLKKHRLEPKEPEIVANSSISALPSPPSEADVDHGVFDHWSSEIVELPVTLDTPPSPAPGPSHSRKRRLSDGAAQGAPKRPRGLIGPRLHAVSDPLPKANEFTADFSDWFTTNFEMPPAVADEVPDPSTLLDVDVECYNWSSMQDCYKLPVDDTVIPVSPPYSTQPYNSFNMDPNPFSITDINPLPSGDNLDELYQNIFGTNSHHPPPYSSQPADGVSSLTCATSDSGITSALPSMPFSDDLFSDGGAWSHLPSYTDAIGSFDSSTVHSSIPESAHPLNLSSILSEIDLSMLHLPTSSPPDIPRPNEEATRLADKQAKLEQLRMLEEAKRRLEAELASDA